MTVKFGTPEAVEYREYDKESGWLDLMLSCRVAGAAEVSDFDQGLYADETAVQAKLREEALNGIKTCLREWPEGESVLRSDKEVILAEHLDRRFAEIGITAKTKITSFALTSESDALYKRVLGETFERSIQSLPPEKRLEYMPHLHNNGQPVLRGPDKFRPTFRNLMQEYKPSSIDEGAPASPATPAGLRMMGDSSIIRMSDKFCRSCGTRHPDGAKYCPECGAGYV